MPRQPRVHYCGAFYHVILRGNNKQDIFYSDRDRFKLSFLIQEACETYLCKIHAFCFMSNHIHMLIEVGETPLSHFMQNVAFRYAQWINKKFEKVGHLFQGRFKAILVDHDEYLLTLVRYIHLNPLNAGLTKYPDDAWWSSHHCYLGKLTFPWVEVGRVMDSLNLDRELAIKSYKAIMAKNQPDLYQETFQETKNILGSSHFLKKLKQDNPYFFRNDFVFMDALEYVCNTYGVLSEDLFGRSRGRRLSEARALLVWLCREYDICSPARLVKVMGRSKSQVSRLANFLPDKTRKDLAQAKVVFESATYRV
jgi:putative transposase